MELSAVSTLNFVLFCCLGSSFFCDVNAGSQVSCPPGCSCDNDGEWKCHWSSNFVTIPSPLPENITSLILWSQNIPTIYRNDFNGLRRLLKIEISDCNVRNIENGTFDNLSELEELVLEWNRLAAIDVNLLRGLHSLRILDLSRNEIERIENGTFINLSKLESLMLANNNLKSLNCGTFSGLHSLKKFDISYSNIEKIEKDTFIDLRILEQLDLDGNKLKILTVDAFSGLYNLSMLRLSNNGIESIENGTFKDLTRLNWLNLNGNNLTKLRADTFMGLHSLAYLLIASSNIHSIESRTFEPLIALNALYMEYNNLASIDHTALNGPQNLTELDLYGNNLISLEIPTSFAISLRELYVSQNEDFSFPPCSLGRLPSLQVLDIFNTSVNLSLDLFIGDGCSENQTIPQLTDLYFENTNTSSISVDLLSRFPDLQHLSFGNNDDDEVYVEYGALEVLQKLALLWLFNMPSALHRKSTDYPLPLLETINLHNPKVIPTEFLESISTGLRAIVIFDAEFNQLPGEAFGNIPSLNKIFISHSSSQISLDRDALKGLPNLTELYLNYLQLSFLPPGFLDYTRQLDTLNLYGNPLSCTCSLAWLVEYSNLQDLYPQGTCSSPSDLVGLSLSDIDYLNCDDITTTQQADSTEDGQNELSGTLLSTSGHSTDPSTTELSNTISTKFISSTPTLHVTVSESTKTEVSSPDLTAMEEGRFTTEITASKSNTQLLTLSTTTHSRKAIFTTLRPVESVSTNKIEINDLTTQLTSNNISTKAFLRETTTNSPHTKLTLADHQFSTTDYSQVSSNASRVSFIYLYISACGIILVYLL